MTVKSNEVKGVKEKNTRNAHDCARQLQRKNIPPRRCQVTDEYRGMPDVLPLAANRDVRDKPVFSRRPERVVPKLTRIPLELAVPAVTQRDAEPVAVLRCRFG